MKEEVDSLKRELRLHQGSEEQMKQVLLEFLFEGKNTII